MQIITDKIKLKELQKMSENMFGNLVKAVVDIEKGIMVLDADMHADLEQIMLENGSAQKDLWGINLYPEFFGAENFIEFDSMINIRPWQSNRSRGVEAEEVRKKIVEVVEKLVNNE
ncbi:MAG TPA: DUF5674 family protein [bacterium]|nr:DUF5674 family protein [bacterium]